MSRKYFIIVPSPHPSGPVKGAYALANALADMREVTMVSLKPGPGVYAPLDKRVTQLSLAGVNGGWRGRIYAYQELLRKSGGRERTASISMCFSADMVNRFCRKEAITCSSVRGNLLQNYRMDYGLPGVPMAIGHLLSLNGFDRVVAMTSVMAKQVGFYTFKSPVVIGNFVDEASLEPYRNNAPPAGPLKFLFLASLSARKQPMLLIRAMNQLRRQGQDVTLDIIGAGSQFAMVRDEVKSLGLDEVVRLHGQLSDPYALLASADAMVMPSLSEGVSRAVLEALHLGVPCVLRDVDGNATIICAEENGALFRRDAELADAMMQAAQLSRRMASRNSLLPFTLRQATAAQRHIEIMESVW